MKNAIIVFSLSLKIGSEFHIGKKNEEIKRCLYNFVTFLPSTSWKKKTQ